jgi:hypothetical protein
VFVQELEVRQALAGFERCAVPVGEDRIPERIEQIAGEAYYGQLWGQAVAAQVAATDREDQSDQAQAGMRGLVRATFLKVMTQASTSKSGPVVSSTPPQVRKSWVSTSCLAARAVIVAAIIRYAVTNTDLPMLTPPGCIFDSRHTNSSASRIP